MSLCPEGDGIEAKDLASVSLCETPRHWHALAADEALACLHSEAGIGLTDAQVAARQAHDGPNALPEPSARPLWRIVAHQFKSPLIYIPFVAGILALALGHHGDAGRKGWPRSGGVAPRVLDFATVDDDPLVSAAGF